MKKIGRCSELAFALGTVLLALGTVLQAKANLGMSAAVAPAYLLAEVLGVQPGTMCYIYQGFLVLLTFALLRRFKLELVVTFASAVAYGLFVNLFTNTLFLDLAELMLFHRFVLLTLGIVVVSVALALILNSYLPPQAAELFAVEAARLLGWSKYKGKYAFDIISCVVSIALSFIFFGEMRIIGAATVLSALVYGPLIGLFSRIFSLFVDFTPLFPRLAALFGVQTEENG